MKGPQSPYNKYIKRMLDIIVSIFLLVFFFWLYIILAVLVKVKLGSPVIFKQNRPGKKDPHTGREKMFSLYKFRTMTNEKDTEGNLLPASERLTPFGRKLRSTSLDELPEIWNILKGDMSFVGPRPLWDTYLDYYNDYERQRHLVRPGLTGLAQVNGRNIASWDKRFELDITYTKNISFFLDIKIIIQTIKKVFAREGIEFTENHQSIMEYFANRGDRSK